MNSCNHHLVLFFTRRTSLRTWHDLGILDRELAMYRRLINRGMRVTLITYGRDDGKLAESLPEFAVCHNRWGLPRRIYEHALHRLHARELRTATLIKTNQTNGADIALRAARFWRKPLIARCGYLWSATEIRNHGPNSVQARRALQVEQRVFPASDRVVVTTQDMANAVSTRFPSVSSRVSVIPNFVDTERFRPSASEQPGFDLIYVGRLSAEKNVPALLEAVRQLDVQLLIVGGGEDQARWQANHREQASTVKWIPRVANIELPGLLRRAKAFVLPSHYEGHPKALLEAMACGCPVIGTNVPGIRELIQHETKWIPLRHGQCRVAGSDTNGSAQ